MDMKQWKGKEGAVIEINYDECAGHGDCVELCPVDVFELVDEKATAPNIDDCIGCCACIVACPTGAIHHSECGY